MFEAVAADPGKAAQRKIRCAVYTRNSTEEGLEKKEIALKWRLHRQMRI